MLQTLRSVKPDVARAVLADASERLFRPAFAHGTKKSGHDPLVDGVLDEVRRRVKAPQTDSNEDRTALLEAISQEASNLVFEGIDKSAVVLRLGNAGRLPLSGYEIRFSPKFKDMANFHLVTEAHARVAILHNDKSEHLSVKTEGPSEPIHASLFMHRPNVKGDPFTVFVKADRLGNILDVDEGFRIYDGEIDSTLNESPLEVLQRFLDKFGSSVRVFIGKDGELSPAVGPKKIILNEVINIPKGAFVVVRQEGGQEVRTSPQLENGQVEICLSYGIAHAPYREQLARHGIHVPLPGVAAQPCTSPSVLAEH